MNGAITSPDQLDPNGTYTVADYVSWQFEGFLELIKGKIVKMAAAPADPHNAVAEEISYIVKNQLRAKGKTCKLRTAPHDVFLPVGQKTGQTVVQPDILIGCDPDAFKYKGYMGAPDWICEIVSPGSARMDTVVKKQLYQDGGVREYMLVFPQEQFWQVYKLEENGAYGEPDVYAEPGQVYSLSSVQGMEIAWHNVFQA